MKRRTFLGRIGAALGIVAAIKTSTAVAAKPKRAVVGRFSRGMFSDDCEGVRRYIDSRLRYMVEIEEDEQLLGFC